MVIHVFFEGSAHRPENVEIRDAFVDFQEGKIDVCNVARTVEIHAYSEPVLPSWPKTPKPWKSMHFGIPSWVPNRSQSAQTVEIHVFLGL